MNSGNNNNKTYPFFNSANSPAGSWTNSGLKSNHGVLNNPPPAHALERKHSLNYESMGSFQRHLLTGYGNPGSLGADSIKGSSSSLSQKFDMSETGSSIMPSSYGGDEGESRDIETSSPPLNYHPSYRNEYMRKKSFDLNALRAIYERNQQYGVDPHEAQYHINQQPHHLQSNFYRSTNNPVLQQSLSDMNNNQSPNFRGNFEDISSAAMLAAQRANLIARNNAQANSFNSPRHVFDASSVAASNSDKSASTASLHKSVSSISSPSSSSFSVSSDNLNLNNQYQSTSSLASSFPNRFGSYFMENPHLQNKHRQPPPPGSMGHNGHSLMHSHISKTSQLPDICELGKLGNFRVGELSSAMVDHHLKSLISNNSGQSVNNDKMFMKDKPAFNSFQPTINKRPKSTFPFGKCKVCSDKATGVHYGIATCEGCKGFFKRSTLRKEKYRCFFGNNCPLTPDNRNRCKSCRFRKCLEVGMSIQGVKMGRIPKAEKEKALMILKYKSEMNEQEESAEGEKNEEQYNYDEISETSSNSQTNDNTNMIDDVEDDYDEDRREDKSAYNIDEYDSDDMGNNNTSEVPSTELSKDNNVIFTVSDMPEMPESKTIKDSRSEKFHMKKQIIFNFNNELNEKDKLKSANDEEESKQSDVFEKEEENVSKSKKKNDCASSSSSLSSTSSSGSCSPILDECTPYGSLEKLSSNPNNFESNSVTDYIDLIAKSSKIEIKESSMMNLKSVFARQKQNEQDRLQSKYEEDEMPCEIIVKKTRTEINRAIDTEPNEKNQIAPDNQSESPNSDETDPLPKQSTETSEDDHSDKQVCISKSMNPAKKRDHTSDSYDINVNSFGERLDLKRKFRINDLLRFHAPFNTASLLPTRNISSMYLPNMDDTYLLISSLLSDKVYQLHIEHNHRVTVLYQKALRLIHDGVKDLNGCEKTLEEVWDALLVSIPLQVKAFIGFVKEVPGLNELNPQDFTTLINNRLFDFFLIKHAPLFINEQSYLVLPNNIHYTRELMTQVIGKEMVDAIFEFGKEFNSLFLTQKEIALTFPYVLTLHDEIYIDQQTVRNLNEYYMRALFYEFDLNKRDSKFVNKWNQVITMFPYLSELQAVKIGGLTPPKQILLENLADNRNNSLFNLIHDLTNIGSGGRKSI